MNRRQTFAVLVGVLGLAGMALYVPYEDVERVYNVVAVQPPGSTLVGMGRIDELRAVRHLSTGYDWVWSTPTPADRMEWFGIEWDNHAVNWRRLVLQTITWALLVFASVLWLRSTVITVRPAR